MAQRRHHYERAFEEYLRARRIPYVAVDEARKALLPGGDRAPPAAKGGAGDGAGASLKSFDFVIYGEGMNLLVDIKGRKVGRRGQAGGRSNEGTGRLESWVTQEDVAALRRWEQLFGGPRGGFEAAFVFVYWCEAQPPDALFQEVFEHRGRWYALRAVRVAEYEAVMKPRSLRWRTVDVPRGVFERVSRPFAPAFVARRGGSGERPNGAGDAEGAALQPLGASLGSPS